MLDEARASMLSVVEHPHTCLREVYRRSRWHSLFIGATITARRQAQTSTVRPQPAQPQPLEQPQASATMLYAVACCSPRPTAKDQPQNLEMKYEDPVDVPFMTWSSTSRW